MVNPAPASQPQVTPPPDPTTEDVRKARLAERRRQLGFQGRMSTFLTDFQGQKGAPASSSSNTLLGQ